MVLCGDKEFPAGDRGLIDLVPIKMYSLFALFLYLFQFIHLSPVGPMGMNIG